MGDVLTKEEDRKVRSLRERLRVQGGTMTADSFLVTKDESLLLSMVDRLVSEIDRLREASKAVFACIECDGEVKADEDGCCSNCGSDCFVLIGLPEEREILRHDISARFEAEIERLRARNEALEQVAKHVAEWARGRARLEDEADEQGGEEHHVIARKLDAALENTDA